MEHSVEHNRGLNRFEVALPDNDFAVLEYRMMDGDLALLHTFVPDSARGQGLADKLATTALDYARSEGLHVRPYCRFVASYVKRHAEYQDLVAEHEL